MDAKNIKEEKKEESKKVNKIEEEPKDKEKNKSSKLKDKEEKQKIEEKKEESKIEDTNKIKKKEAKKLVPIKDISDKSTKEEVAKFFELKFNISQDISNNLINEYISGDILPNLSFDDFKLLGLNLDTIINWNKYYDENEDKFNNCEIRGEISIKASSEKVNQFFVSYLDFKEYIKNLNGQMLLKLNEEQMKKLGMKIGQRKRLIKFINYLNKMKNMIKINSSKEEVTNFLLKNTNLSKQTIEKFGFDGKSLFSFDLNVFDQENFYHYYKISESERDNLKSIIQRIRKPINKIELFNAKPKFNIFLIIFFKENYFQNLKCSFYYENFTIKKFCAYRILNKTISKEISKNEICELFLIKVESDDLVKNLYLNFKVINEEYNLKLNINNYNEIHNYFSFEDFFFDKNNLLEKKRFKVPIDIIFNEFLAFIFNKKLHNKRNYEKNMIESLFEKRKIILSGNNILKAFKYYVKNKLKYHIQFDKIDIDYKIESPIKKEYIISDDDLKFLKNKNMSLVLN